MVTDPAKLAIVALGALVWISVALGLSVLRGSMELRRARTFLHFGEYERMYLIFGVALSAIAAGISYALFALPGTVDTPVDYFNITVMYAAGILIFLRTFLFHRKHR